MFFSFAVSCEAILEDPVPDGGYCVCSPNYVGDRCQYCDAGYFGEPEVPGTYVYYVVVGQIGLLPVGEKNTNNILRLF